LHTWKCISSFFITEGWNAGLQTQAQHTWPVQSQFHLKILSLFKDCVNSVWFYLQFT